MPARSQIQNPSFFLKSLAHHFRHVLIKASKSQGKQKWLIFVDFGLLISSATGTSILSDFLAQGIPCRFKTPLSFFYISS